MKTKHLLLIGTVIAFSSCSTAYRTGQTPDDVYYSPAPVQESYVTSNNDNDRRSYAYRDEEEQEIRRGIQDPRYRGNYLPDISLSMGYGYSPYYYNPYSYNSYYNPYSYNPYGYKGIYDPYGYYPSPFYGNYYGGGGYGGYGNYYSPVFVYPGVGSLNTNKGPRRVNLSAFSNSTNNSIIRANTPGVSTGSRTSVPVRSFTPTTPQNNTGGRQGSGVSNVIRRVFTPSENRTYTPSNNNNNRTYSTERRTSETQTRTTPPTRTFDNTPSTNSSSSGSGSAPVRTFRR